jgi:hypothetical protein
LFGHKHKNHQIHHKIASEFDVSLIGDPKRVVGLHVARKEHQLNLHQSVYASEVPKRFSMENSKPVSTPITKIDTSEQASVEADKKLFMQFLGSVMFLAIGTRPDLSYTISYLSRALQQPTVGHWIAAKHMLRYLSGSKNVGLIYTKNKKFPDIQIYADADWANHDDRRSISGVVSTTGGTAISWISKRQSTVALSTTEAEYQALAEAAKEALWIRNFLNELNHPVTEPTVIWNDNTGAIALAHDPIHHARTKHIGIKHHFIRDLIENNVVSLRYKSSDQMPADLLTKALGGPVVKQHRTILGLKEEEKQDNKAVHGVHSEGGCCD